MRFMIYLYQDGTPNSDAIGTIAFYDKGEKQIGNVKQFNHWDEIPKGLRKLVEENGYIKRSGANGWEFEKK
jgi:hypothetical protein